MSVPPGALPPPDALAAAYRHHGLSIIEVRKATPAEVAASHSSWAKRLRAGAERPVTRSGRDLRQRALSNAKLQALDTGIRARGDGGLLPFHG